MRLDVATNYTFARVMREPLTSLDSLVARVQFESELQCCFGGTRRFFARRPNRAVLDASVGRRWRNRLWNVGMAF